MSEHVIRSLQSQLTALVKANENATIELRNVLGPIKELPRLIEMQAKATERAVSGQTTAIAKMELAHLMAELRGFASTREAQNELLERVSEDLREEVAEVEARYAKLQAELDTVSRERIEALDGAALALMLQVLPAVRERYVRGVLPAQEVLTDEPALASNARAASLEEEAAEVLAMLRAMADNVAMEGSLDSELVADEPASQAPRTLTLAHFSKGAEKPLQQGTWHVLAPEGSREGWVSALEPMVPTIERRLGTRTVGLGAAQKAVVVDAVAQRLSARWEGLTPEVKRALAARIDEALDITVAQLSTEATDE